VLVACQPVLDRQSQLPAASTAKKERRRAKRDPLSGSLAVLWGLNPGEERVSQASLIDVSARGAKFRVAERVPPGAWLMFNYHQVGISGRGTVRYCRMVRSSYLIGVEFSGGTGWRAGSERFTAQLQNLGVAIDQLETAEPAAV